jgi:hypothetical protein
VHVTAAGAADELGLLRGTQDATAIAALVERLPETLLALSIAGHEVEGALAPVLGRTWLGGATLRAQTERLGRLESLCLAGTQVDDRALEAIPASTRLASLDLSYTPCSGTGVRPLLERCGGGLRQLRLVQTRVDVEFVESLGAAVALPRLEMLDLTDCDLDGDALVHLAGAADLPRLETLRLSRCPLGMCIAVDPPRLGALRELWLDDTRIDVPEPAVLFDPEALPRLEQ